MSMVPTTAVALSNASRLAREWTETRDRIIREMLHDNESPRDIAAWARLPVTEIELIALRRNGHDES